MRSLVVLVLTSKVAFADATSVIARLEEAIADRDEPATRSLLADTISLDGVRFANAACDERAAIVTRRVLAHCLVEEGLATTTRRTDTTDAAVVTFTSGIEVELAVIDGRVHALATTSHHGTPALSPAALEKLRTAGSRDLDARVAARLTNATAWLEVCVSATGKTTSAFLAGDPHAGRVFRVAIADWRFRAFALRKSRIATCTPLAFHFPEAGTVDAIPVVAVAPSSASTADSLLARYKAVGKRRTGLDPANGLFVRFRAINIFTAIRDDDARRGALAELEAIDRAIDQP